MQQMTLVVSDLTGDDLNCPDHKSHCVQESQVKMNLHFIFGNNAKVFMQPPQLTQTMRMSHNYILMNENLIVGICFP